MGMGPSVARLLLQRVYHLSLNSMNSVLPQWTAGLNQVRRHTHHTHMCVCACVRALVCLLHM